MGAGPQPSHLQVSSIQPHIKIFVSKGRPVDSVQTVLQAGFQSSTLFFVKNNSRLNASSSAVFSNPVQQEGDGVPGVCIKQGL